MNSVSAGFGGCLGVLSAMILVCGLLLFGCTQAIHRNDKASEESPSAAYPPAQPGPVTR